MYNLRVLQASTASLLYLQYLATPPAGSMLGLCFSPYLKLHAIFGFTPSVARLYSLPTVVLKATTTDERQALPYGYKNSDLTRNLGEFAGRGLPIRKTLSHSSYVRTLTIWREGARNILERTLLAHPLTNG
jgi:hypothetical protein